MSKTKKLKSKEYWEKREALLAENFTYQTDFTFKRIRTVYKWAMKEIEREILVWESRKEKILKESPEFRFSELKTLQDLKESTRLVLEEMYKVESRALSDSLDQLFVKDLVDMEALDKQYTAYKKKLEQAQDTPISLAIQAQANYPQNLPYVEEVLKNPVQAQTLSQNIWYVGYAGIDYKSRINQRAKMIQGELEDIFTQSFIRGESYGQTAKRVMERLNVSYSNAKRLVQTELRMCEVKANCEHAKRLGFKYKKRKTVKDARVCKKCQELEGRVYLISDLEKNPYLAIAHPNERCYLIEVSDVKGERLYAEQNK